MKNVLIVGSSVIDLFATVSSSHIKIEDSNLILSLGDKIPTNIKSFAVGGNGANISVGLTRLGIPSTFYTYLGKDILSREIEEKLRAEGVEVVGEKEESYSTPLHIIFDFSQDRIIFSHYPYSRHTFLAGKFQRPDFIFLNSIADEWENAYKKVLEYAKSENISLAFSPGTRQIDSMDDTVFEVLKMSKVFFSNKEEAFRILNIDTGEIKEVLLKIKDLGLEVASVTDGKNGAYAIDKEGKIYQISPLDPDSKSSDKTGAGDAYASGFFSAYLMGKNVTECMRWGAINSNGVMQKVGAQNGLLTIKQMEKLSLEKNNFQPKEI